MELTVKYQYTYFLYPYIVDVNKYQKYIMKLLKKEKCKLKIFEKERDLDIYNYFNKTLRENLFPTFELRNESLKEFNELSDERKSKIISEYPCAIFEYDISDLAKKDEDEIDIRKKDTSIEFNVSKIEIICFNTGVCFISIKTNVEDSESFSDLLNFNYKFRELNSEFNDLKQYENINIKTNSLKDLSDIKDIIEEIAGEEKNKVNLNKQKFYTFAYACIQNENWNDRSPFEDLENEFLKYANVFPSNYLTDLNKKSYEQNVSVISKLKYVRTGITNTSCNLLASTVDMYNYTKLPYEYENQIFYTYILSLYQKIFLSQINSEFKNYDQIIRIRRQFISFAKELWVKDITTDDTGSLYYRVLKNVFELDDLFEEIRKKYEIIYKDLKIEKNNRDNTIIVMLLILSLILNTFSIIAYLFLI